MKARIIWQPVLASDWQGPGKGAMSRIADPRASQRWDPDLLVEGSARPVLRASATPIVGKESLVKGSIVWDYVAVYAPGVEWKTEFPVPDFQAAPVVKTLDELRARLSRAGL